MDNVNKLFEDFPRLFSKDATKADKKLIGASIANKVAANMDLIEKAAETYTTTTTETIYL